MPPLPDFTSAFLGALLVSYLLGSVPFGFTLAKLLRGVDIRTIGSGNIGATNAMRVLGKPLGIVAFLLDFAKGAVPAAVIAPLAVPPDQVGVAAVLCGLAAVLGHVFPIYLRFKGGKAVATGCGVVVAIDPVVFLISGLVWLLLWGTTRMVALASIGLGLALPITAGLRAGSGGAELTLFCVGLCLLILVRHRSNIRRMIAGTEPRGGHKPPGSDG
ncbi:glycerol-3-phosphate 1-O-acyltransferase PlsY [Engelhardtia mirabilis]|uniref:Glycerol-3-phosphate acyltransferase n=1 Tax=Engelhardtia mirabilis TaxID=2528011 RepID=A0A518BH71_9BACT|nr:Glycerol-3-phosphate acyltransferase [Planctomycetes bacterium Pla133]QDV00641.1 Glycerol-3-phosphate acyltransferase [Planctomycetes bacterium Pla86]